MGNVQEQQLSRAQIALYALTGGGKSTFKHQIAINSGLYSSQDRHRLSREFSNGLLWKIIRISQRHYGNDEIGDHTRSLMTRLKELQNLLEIPSDIQRLVCC